MRSVLICFQHTTTIIRVNPSKNNSTESQNLPAIPQITPAINSNFPSTAKAQPPKRVYPLYLRPRSKVWMRALKASIQTAATKVTNIGVRLSSGASFCLRQIPIYISIFFLCSLRFASSLSSTYNTAVTGIANIIPIAPKRLPPINAALNVQSGASPTEPPTTLG